MLWVLIGFTFGIFVLLYFLLYFLGIEKTLISFVKSNEIEFRMKSGTLTKILENVPRFKLEKKDIRLDKLDSNGKVVSTEQMEAEIFTPLKNEKKKKHFLGIYIVGLPPYYKILKWTFGWDRNITEGQKKEEEEKGRLVEKSEVGDQWISHASEEVTSLYHIYTYPIIVKGIELPGLITIDIAFNVKIEAVIPIIPVIFLKGKWFAQFTSIFKGIISDYLRYTSLNDFEAMDKGSEFGSIICKNESRFVGVTGMKASDVAYIDYRVGGSVEMQEAASAEKVAELKGKGTIKTATANAIAEIKKATGEAKAVRLNGAAKARALKNLLEEASKFPNGVEILREQIRTEATVGFTGDVLSQGATTPLQLAVDTNRGGNKKKKVVAKETAEKESGKKKGEEQ